MRVELSSVNSTSTVDKNVRCVVAGPAAQHATVQCCRLETANASCVIVAASVFGCCVFC